MNILVVDDTETDRAIVGKIIARGGHHARFAKDGEEAITAMLAEKPDLVLLDVVMPNRDGFATLRQIKKDPNISDVPVVMVTTKSTEADKVWAVKLGAADLVAKATVKDTLLPAIKKLQK
jgi:twitching motility two-component system response regulator PilH